MTTSASPPEFDALLEQLEPLRGQMRRWRPAMTEGEITAAIVRVARMSFEVVATCPACGEPVRRCDRRVSTENGLAHQGCTGREPERELTGGELREAKDREVRRLAALGRQAAARLERSR